MTETKEEKNVSTLPVHVNGETTPPPRRWRRKRMACCCGTTVAVIILIALVFVLLGLTVFKARDPRVTINSAKLERFNIHVDPLGMKVELNVSLELNVSVKNPNRASFKFGNSTTALYYRGTRVGEALIPAGKIGADRTIKINTTVNIEGERVITDPNLLGDVLSGELPMSHSTRVSGRVNFLNVFKHHAVSYYACNITVVISNATIQDQQCSHSIKL